MRLGKKNDTTKPVIESTKDSDVLAFDFDNVMHLADVEDVRTGICVSGENRKAISKMSDDYTAALKENIQEKIKPYVHNEIGQNIRKILELNEKKIKLERNERILTTKKGNGVLSTHERLELAKIGIELNNISNELVKIYDDSQSSTLLDAEMCNIENDVLKLRKEFDDNTSLICDTLRAQIELIRQLRSYVLNDTKDIFYLEVCKALGLTMADSDKVKESIRTKTPLSNQFIEL